MKKGRSEVICILDRSGSMSSTIDDAVGGINTLLEDHRKDDPERRFTIVMFDGEYEVPFNHMPVKHIPQFTKETYSPRGSTAMYDAIGRTIDDVGKRLDETAESDRPEKIVVAILTDGQENASNKYHASKIKSMIEHQTNKYSWTFLFLAANQDAVTAGAQFGIAANNAMNYSSTGVGTRSAFAFYSKASVSATSAQFTSLAAMNNNSNTLAEDLDITKIVTPTTVAKPK